MMMVVYILWLKYHASLNWAKRERTWCLLMGTVLVLGISWGIFFITQFYYSTQLLLTTQGAYILPRLVLATFAYLSIAWVLLGLFRGISTPDMSRLFRLVRFPYRLWRLYAADVTLGLFNPWLLIFYLLAVWLGTLYGMKQGLVPAVGLLFIIALFVLANHMLVYMLSLLLADLIRSLSRHRGKLIFFSAILLGSVYSMLGHYVDIDTLIAPINHSAAYWVLTPPGLVSELLLGFHAGRLAGWPAVGLIVYAVSCGIIAYFLLKKRLYERPLQGGEAILYNVNTFEKLTSAFEGLFNCQVANVAAKELIYILRENRLRLILLSTLLWGIAIPLIHVAKGVVVGPYSLLLLLPICVIPYAIFYNIFGLESTGVVFNFLAPIQPKTILVGKNLAYLLVQGAIAGPSMAWTFYLSWGHTDWSERLAIILIMLYLSLLHTLIGNIASVLYPLKLSPGNIVGRYLSLQADFLAIVGLSLSAIIIGAGLYYFHEVVRQPIILLSLLAAMCITTAIFYTLTLQKAAEVWLDKRDLFLIRFCS